MTSKIFNFADFFIILKEIAHLTSSSSLYAKNSKDENFCKYCSDLCHLRELETRLINFKSILFQDSSHFENSR